MSLSFTGIFDAFYTENPLTYILKPQLKCHIMQLFIRICARSKDKSDLNTKNKKNTFGNKILMTLSTI